MKTVSVVGLEKLTITNQSDVFLISRCVNGSRVSVISITAGSFPGVSLSNFCDCW